MYQPVGDLFNERSGTRASCTSRLLGSCPPAAMALGWSLSEGSGFRDLGRGFWGFRMRVHKLWGVYAPRKPGVAWPCLLP